MDKYYIRNSFLIQDLRIEWEGKIKRFNDKFHPLVEEDLEYLSTELTKLVDKICPIKITISVDSLEQIAELLGIKFYLKLKEDGNIEFDFQPILHCLGKDLRQYQYAGVID